MDNLKLKNSLIGFVFGALIGYACCYGSLATNSPEAKAHAQKLGLITAGIVGLVIAAGMWWIMTHKMEGEEE